MADQSVTIRFEGRPLSCRAGTSVAAALWEHGIRDLSHSPKYGRPRGVTCARGQCTACLMRVDGVPNVRVCETEVQDGMTVLRQDAGAFYGAPMQKSLAAGGSLFPVGFYYKWFTRPPFVSRTFLKAIRPLTGVGRLPDAVSLRALPPAGDAPAPSRDLGRWDTVVVGAGAAGMRAAAEAAAGGGRVLLLDENAEAGGLRLQALRELAATDDPATGRFRCLGAALETLEAAAASLAASAVTVRLQARVVAGYAPGGLVVREGASLATVQADRVVWAAGALDSLGLFAGNDAPGCLGPRALLRLLVRDGLDVSGCDALVAGSGLDLWLAANLLVARGARVGIVVTGEGRHEDIAAAVGLKWTLTTGLELDAVGRRGARRLAASFTPGGGTSTTRLDQEADLVVICGRGKPAYDIAYQLGADLVLDPARGGFAAPDAFAPAGGVPLAAAGEAAGVTPDELLAKEAGR